MKNIELFDLVDENDNVIGTVTREEVHGNPSLIHRVAHVLVFNSSGYLYLQKRADDKDVQPGRWDTSVGGHVDSGEEYAAAAYREMKEELGITDTRIEPVHKYLHSNEFESEYVSTFKAVWDGTITFDPGEIADGRFWSLEEIERRKPEGIFTPNFLDELDRYQRREARRPHP